MRTCFAAWPIALMASVASAQQIYKMSLDEANKIAATGDISMLVNYAEGEREGFEAGFLYVGLNELVDLRTFSSKPDDESPFLREGKCLGNLDPAELVRKALSMKPHRPDITGKVELFATALRLTFTDACPAPTNYEIAFKSSQPGAAKPTEWILIGKSDAGRKQLFVNTSSIIISGNVRRVWSKLVFAPGTMRGFDADADKWMNYHLTHDAYNCAEGTSSQDALTVYYTDGSTIGAGFPLPTPWTPVEPDGVVDQVMHFTCAWRPK